MVKASPGLGAGYWLQLEHGPGFSKGLLDTEDRAQASAPPVGSSPNPAVTIDTVELPEVAASA